MRECGLSIEKIKLLNTWISISDIIEDIYESMKEIEIKYGKDSIEYSKLKERLVISLEVEEEILESFNNYKELNLVNDYLLEFNSERVINKLNLNIDEVKVEDIFSYIYCNNIIELINKDLENTDSKKKREVLVEEKYNFLIDYPNLENSFFNFDIDIDSTLIRDSSFVSNYLNISLDNYKQLRRKYFVDMFISSMNEVLDPNNREVNDLRYRMIMDIRLRSCVLELGDSDIEYLYSCYERKDYKSSIIENAFYKSSDDFKSKKKVSSR